jgi:hypothetical protein
MKWTEKEKEKVVDISILGALTHPHRLSEQRERLGLGPSGPGTPLLHFDALQGKSQSQCGW